MRVALLLSLAALAADDERANGFFERIRFEKPEAPGEEGRRVLEILLKKEHWVGAYRTLEERFGKFPDDLALSVDFRLQGDKLGSARAGGTKGEISFNFQRLVEGQKKLDDFERLRIQARAEGKVLIVKIPALKFDRIIYHEMTHILQRNYDAPGWFTEGMAEFVADDENAIYSLAASGRRVKEVDDPVAERIDTYARGHLFWNWLDERGAAKKAIELSIVQRRPWKEAIEESAGIPWTVIVPSERDWSIKEVERRRN
jgi:hypothetical protein